jgi:para-nitrobenzyl esterase
MTSDRRGEPTSSEPRPAGPAGLAGPAEAAHGDEDSSAAPVVATTAGDVRGVWRTEGTEPPSAAFLGIPFAEPPVGERRFLAPVPKAGWDDVLDGTAYGPTPQRGGDPETQGIPEPSIPGDSTLTVNVFSPRVAEHPLPVMVWIHGGGFTAGSPASPWYDGRAFNRDGVVSVTVSYRLGFDGFGWIPGAPHNRGVLDWMLALEWVRDNIARFGGDPRRVTIAGQSAGGGAVLTLLGMPAAQHLFHGALCLSGATADVSLVRAEAFSRRLAQTAGVQMSLEGFRGLPEDQVLAAQHQPGRRRSLDPLAGVRVVLDDGLPLGPVTDGDLLPRRTVTSLSQGIGSDKPLMLGATDDEFSNALRGYENVLRFVPAGLLLDRLGMARHARRAYRAGIREATGPGTAAVIGRYVTDRVFRAPVVRVARARAEAPTWVYRFARRSPASGLAVHCADLPYWFDCLDGPRVSRLTGEAPPQALADAMHAAAVRFVREGDPGWLTWSTHTSPTMVFGDDIGVSEDAYADVGPLTD